MASRARKAEFLALLEPVKDALARYAYRNVRNGPDAPDVSSRHDIEPISIHR